VFKPRARYSGEMEKVKTYPYDSADYLTTAEAIKYYIDDIIETEDPELIALAFGTVARSKGMSEIARKTGLSRESLYKALSAEGNPEFATILKVLKALDLKITTTAA
jgi:probable addiction module antidote protein